MGSEEAILYSYDLATLPSIIPAFASKKDLILCDEVCCSWEWLSARCLRRALRLAVLACRQAGWPTASEVAKLCCARLPSAAPPPVHRCMHCRASSDPTASAMPNRSSMRCVAHLPTQGVNYGIQNGANLSRAKVLFFKHNDLQVGAGWGLLRCACSFLLWCPCTTGLLYCPCNCSSMLWLGAQVANAPHLASPAHACVMQLQLGCPLSVPQDLEQLLLLFHLCFPCMLLQLLTPWWFVCLAFQDLERLLKAQEAADRRHRWAWGRERTL